MICPHCERDLLRKERIGNRCSFCRRRYALDPKANRLRANDLRIRRVLARLSAEGHVAVAPGQLWYALSRRSLTVSRFGAAWNPLLLVAGIPLVMAGVLVPFAPAFLAGGAFLLLALFLVVARGSGVGRGVPLVDRDAFRSVVLDPWRRVYGGLPPGMVDEPVRQWRPYGASPARKGTGVVAPAPSRPVGVLLCPDPSVVAFLAAEGLPGKYGLALARDLDGVGELLAPAPNAPVIVLHDADAHGVLLVRHTRDAFPRARVVDAGIPVRRVRGLAQAVPVRDRWRRPDAAARRELASLGDFDEAELKWLGRGWGFPLVGLPPARLLDAVARCAAHTTGRPDPVRREAAALGFTTWPAPAGPDLAAGR